MIRRRSNRVTIFAAWLDSCHGKPVTCRINVRLEITELSRCASDDVLVNIIRGGGKANSPGRSSPVIHRSIRYPPETPHHPAAYPNAAPAPRANRNCGTVLPQCPRSRRARHRVMFRCAYYLPLLDSRPAATLRAALCWRSDRPDDTRRFTNSA